MKIKGDFEIKKWSGGTTIELFIYPDNANYQAMDFDYRLSTATVEVEESTFTPLKSVSRKLIVLDGTMSLEHENEHSKTLEKFEVDEFDGAWNTSSKGKCIDFNLMLRNNKKGTVKGLEINSGEKIKGEIFGSRFFMYVYKGKVEIEIHNELVSVNESELCSVNSSGLKYISLKALEKSEVVLVEIL